MQNHTDAPDDSPDDSTVLETSRLRLRLISADDAAFILRLLNEQSFIQNIGDRNVRTLEDARAYILKGPIASYEKHGFGLWLLETRETGERIGICGLLKRDVLPDVDIGYALVPEFWSKGYAMESASAVLSYASGALGLKRVVAVVNANNQSSIRLLEKMGFAFEQMVRLAEDAPEIKLYASQTALHKK
jgi:ribosomal-protein-alanine N-acetyltransferase